jgi:transposase
VEDRAVKAGGAALTDWMVAAGRMGVEVGMVLTSKASSSPAQHGPPQSPSVLREERLDERDRALSSRSWAFTASSMAAAIDIFTSKYRGCP